MSEYWYHVKHSTLEGLSPKYIVHSSPVILALGSYGMIEEYNTIDIFIIETIVLARVN